MNNGVVGGIGEGLSSFVQAYQTALNYQLEKAKAANQSDYQQKMALAAQQTANNGAVSSASQLADTPGGTSALRQFGGGLGLKPMASPAPQQAPLQAPQASNPPPQGTGLMTAQSPGLIGPPTPTQALGGQQIQGPSQPQTAGLMDYPGKQEFAAQLARNAQVFTGNEASLRNGQNQTLGIDPKTGQPTVISQGPLTGPALQAAQKNKAETDAAVDLPTQRLTEAFQVDPAVKNSSDVASSYNQLKRGYNSQSPTAQEDMFFSIMKMASPGQAVREAPLEDLQKLPAWNQRFEDLYHKAFSGTVSQRTKDDLMRAGAELANGNASNYQDIKTRYSKMANDRGAKPSFINNPLIEKTGPDSEQMLGKLGPFTPSTPGWAQSAASKLGGFIFPNTGAQSANAGESKYIGAPKVGTNQKGYIFQGGDPQSQLNWKKAQ